MLFTLCAPLSPNGRPPVVVTVAWLYESLEKGFFVDSEAFRPDRCEERNRCPPSIRELCPLCIWSTTYTSMGRTTRSSLYVGGRCLQLSEKMMQG